MGDCSGTATDQAYQGSFINGQWTPVVVNLHSGHWLMLGDREPLYSVVHAGINEFTGLT